MEADEVANLLDLVENCDTDAMSNTQKAHIAHAQKRDLALISLLLGTGMRVSECVGIDIDDIDFRNSSVKVTRKGGNESTLYFNDEVEESLLDYIRSYHISFKKNISSQIKKYIRHIFIQRNR